MDDHHDTEAAAIRCEEQMRDEECVQRLSHDNRYSHEMSKEVRLVQRLAYALCDKIALSDMSDESRLDAQTVASPGSACMFLQEVEVESSRCSCTT